MIALSFGLLAAFLQGTGQPLIIDPARDLLLHSPIKQFFEGARTCDELDRELRKFAREFEAKPYKVGKISIDMSKMPEDLIAKYLEVVTRIIGPTLERFTKGDISAADAAIKVAPFVLVFGGAYGFDPQPGEDPTWFARSQALTLQISAFAAP